MRCEAIRCSKLVHPLGWRWGCLTLSRFVSQQEKQNNPSGYVKTPKFDIFQKKLASVFKYPWVTCHGLVLASCDHGNVRLPQRFGGWIPEGVLFQREEWQVSLVAKGQSRMDWNAMPQLILPRTKGLLREWFSFASLYIIDQAFVEMLSPKRAFLLFELGGKFCLSHFLRDPSHEMIGTTIVNLPLTAVHRSWDFGSRSQLHVQKGIQQKLWIIISRKTRTSDSNRYSFFLRPDRMINICAAGWHNLRRTLDFLKNG